MSKLSLAQNISEIEEIIEKDYPTWLVAILNDYSRDYPHLSGNWKTLCKKMDVSPQKIVLVKDINFEEKSDPKIEVCEILTKKGYVIRRMTEFVPCIICNRAIPCVEIWHLLKEKGFSVPEIWENKCSGC